MDSAQIFPKFLENMSDQEVRALAFSILNTGPQSIILLDENKRIVLYNKNAEREILRLFGKQLPAGRSFEEFVPDCRPEYFRKNFDLALHGQVVNSVFPIHSPDKEAWYEVCYSPLQNMNNRFVGLCMTFWPLTDLKETEKMLIHRIGFEKVISNISAKFVSLVDFDEAINGALAEIGRFTGASRAYIFIYGESNKIKKFYEWCNEGIDPIADYPRNIPPEAVPWWMETINKNKYVRIDDVASLPAQAEFEKRLFDKMGIKALIALPLYNQNAIAGFVGLCNVHNKFVWQDNDLELLKVCSEVFGNAVQRKKNEEIINMMSLALHYSPNSVVISDIHADIEYVNPNFCKITGYDEKEIIGMNMRILRSGYHDKTLFEDMWKTILEGSEWRGELLNKNKNGDLYWEAISISPLRDQNGKITHFVSVREDITKRKAMELEIEKRNLELSSALESLKKAQNQLVQNEKLAAIGLLAAGVAHEINNPLGFIISNFSVLKSYVLKIEEILLSYSRLRNEKDPNITQAMLEEISRIEKTSKLDFILKDLKEILEDSMEGLDRVAYIVNGLKSFAREQAVASEDYDIRNGIRNTLLLSRNEIKYAARVIEDLKEVPIIRANSQQVNQVLLNIILNAVHAIKSRTLPDLGEITIKTYHDERYVYCEISDNGTGIPAEALDKIFDPFFTTKPVGEGTGLGLSIAYDIIVNKHRGILQASNLKDSGARFLIGLPIMQERIE